MKKKTGPKAITIRPPEGWPPRAQQLFGEFEVQLRQRVKNARASLLALHHFFPCQQLQGLSFREFPGDFIDAYLAPHTANARNSCLAALCAWLRFLHRRKELLLPLHEEMAGRRVAVKSRRTLLSHDQVLQILQLPPTDEPEGLRDRAVLEMAYAAGVRRGELAGLDLADMDLTQGLVSLRRTKNSYQRTVPLTRWALHYLQRYLREARPQLSSTRSMNALWLGKTGGRLRSAEVGRRLKKVYRVREVLGFAVTLHQLRHACATHLLNAGAPLRDIQELLGHRELQSTQTYTHLTPVRLRQVHQCCHPRNSSELFPPGNFLEPEK